MFNTIESKSSSVKNQFFPTARPLREPTCQQQIPVPCALPAMPTSPQRCQANKYSKLVKRWKTTRPTYKIKNFLNMIVFFLEGQSLPIVTTSGSVQRLGNTACTMVVNTASLNYIVVAHKHPTSGHNFMRVEVTFSSHLKENIGWWVTRTYREILLHLRSSEPWLPKCKWKKGWVFIVFCGVFIWKTRVYHVQCTWIKIGSFQPLRHQEYESFCGLFEKVPKSAVANKQPFQLVI